MKRHGFILGLTMAAGFVAGGIGSQVLDAQPTADIQPMAIQRTPLSKTDLEGGKEANIYVAEIAPGARAGRHFHPGHEFVYVLEGAGTLEIDGQPPRLVKAGEHFSPALKQPHDLKNASQTEPVKVLAFLISEKGQPMAVMLEGPMAQQPAAGSSGTTGAGAASSGAQPSASPQ